METKNLQKVISETFKGAFGRTPLKLRLEDILGEAIELSRYTDISNLREEYGDLLCSVLAGIEENGWNAEELCQENIDKIKRRHLQYKSLGRKIKVALLGGAFNPVTDGHIKLAQFVLNTSKTFDEVWLIPCYTHMYNKVLESPEHRLEMCKIATKIDARIKVFDYEIQNQFKGETYHLLVNLLNESYAKNEVDFSWVIGLDNANTFNKWVNYEHLEKLIRFVVVPRKGISPDPKVDWYIKPPHIYLCGETDIPEVSSTEMREALRIYWATGKANSIIMNSLNPDVFEYIKINSLYRR